MLRAIEVAVDDLDTADQQRWAELAVFAGQGGVPESAIAALWQPFDEDELDTGERISRFLARSLLQAAGDGRYRLHDLQYDVAFLRLGPDPACSQSLAPRAAGGRLRPACRRRGWSPPRRPDWAGLVAALACKPAADPAWRVADDGYMLDHLVGHLRGGGREQEAAELLADYDWITMGLARRGLAELAGDYDGLPAGDPFANSA